MNVLAQLSNDKMIESNADFHAGNVHDHECIDHLYVDSEAIEIQCHVDIIDY